MFLPDICLAWAGACQKDPLKYKKYERKEHLLDLLDLLDGEGRFFPSHLDENFFFRMC